MAKLAFLTVFLLVTVSTAFSNQNVVEKALKTIDFKGPREDFFPVRIMHLNNQHVGRKIKHTAEEHELTCENRKAPCDENGSCDWVELITKEECRCEDKKHDDELHVYTCIPLEDDELILESSEEEEEEY